MRYCSSLVFYRLFGVWSYSLSLSLSLSIALKRVDCDGCEYSKLLNLHHPAKMNEYYEIICLSGALFGLPAEVRVRKLRSIV